jgi:hypothetical protein
MNAFNIRRAFRDMKEKGWSRLYWCIDLHDVVIEGKYNKFNEGAAIFPHAKEFFHWANKRKNMILVLWTSSYEDALEKTLLRLGEEGILCFILLTLIHSKKTIVFVTSIKSFILTSSLMTRRGLKEQQIGSL